MIHVVYKGRALPLAWLVRRGKKGHFPEDLHLAVVQQVHDRKRSRGKPVENQLLNFLAFAHRLY
jgi:hypothetical protein